MGNCLAGAPTAMVRWVRIRQPKSGGSPGRWKGSPKSSTFEAPSNARTVRRDTGHLRGQPQLCADRRGTGLLLGRQPAGAARHRQYSACQGTTGGAHRLSTSRGELQRHIGTTVKNTPFRSAQPISTSDRKWGGKLPSEQSSHRQTR